MKNIITNFNENLIEKDLKTVGSIFDYLNAKYFNKHLNCLKDIEYELEKLNFLKIFNQTNETNFDKVFVTINDNGILNISVR